MFQKYIFDVTDIISPLDPSFQTTQYNLSIYFTSSKTYGEQRKGETPYVIPYSEYPYQEPNRNYVRKAQCHFGWDWGPAFLSAGVWKPAYLIYASSALMIDTATNHFRLSNTSLDRWSVNSSVSIVSGSSFPLEGNLSLSVAGFETSIPIFINPTRETTSFQISMEVRNVGIWWPRGYGQQKLYPLTIQLESSFIDPNSGQIFRFVETRVQNFGFRDVVLEQKPLKDQIGETFFLKVNDIPIFSKGSNWIPADSFEPRVNTSRLENLLQSAFDANMNIVRNWGGGIYQHDAFYDICDRLGLMVWEEFMFACSMYPRDRTFLDSVRGEVKHQVRRLMHHSSIVIWSANNENEIALGGWYRETIENPFLYVSDYDALYSAIVRPTLLLQDTSRPWLPSSPSNGVLETDPYVQRWGNPSSNDYGDVHYYNYDAPCANVTFFPTPRFASEYGWQSLPSLISWIPVTEPIDREWASPLMIHRQHHPTGYEQIAKMMSFYFKLPKNISE